MVAPFFISLLIKGGQSWHHLLATREFLENNLESAFDEKSAIFTCLMCSVTEQNNLIPGCSSPFSKSKLAVCFHFLIRPSLSLFFFFSTWLNHGLICFWYCLFLALCDWPQLWKSTLCSSEFPSARSHFSNSLKHVFILLWSTLSGQPWIYSEM